MSEHFLSTEAIILKAIPFRDYDQILTLMTLEAGLIKVLYKGCSSQRKGGLGISLPLTKVELVYKEKRGELFHCHEIKLIDSFPMLRKEFIFLEVACDLVQVILETQLPCKTSPLLYRLLSHFLNKIPLTHNPWLLSMSFRLKILQHEGIVVFPFSCNQCGKTLEEEAYFNEFEWWCGEHRQHVNSVWRKEELELVYQLALSQSYREICSETLNSGSQKKIVNFFEMCLKQT